MKKKIRRHFVKILVSFCVRKRKPTVMLPNLFFRHRFHGVSKALKESQCVCAGGKCWKF